MAVGYLKHSWSELKTLDAGKNLKYCLNICVLTTCENSSILDIRVK